MIRSVKLVECPQWILKCQKLNIQWCLCSTSWHACFHQSVWLSYKLWTNFPENAGRHTQWTRKTSLDFGWLLDVALGSFFHVCLFTAPCSNIHSPGGVKVSTVQVISCLEWPHPSHYLWFWSICLWSQTVWLWCLWCEVLILLCCNTGLFAVVCNSNTLRKSGVTLPCNVIYHLCLNCLKSVYFCVSPVFPCLLPVVFCHFILHISSSSYEREQIVYWNAVVQTDGSMLEL